MAQNESSSSGSKRKYDEEIAEKLKKMRSIHEKMDPSPKTNIRNTCTDKPDLIPIFIKKTVEIPRNINPADMSVRKNEYIQPKNNIMDKTNPIEPIKHKLPVVASPDRVRYNNRGVINNVTNNECGIYVKKLNQSAFTLFKNKASNTHSFDANMYEIIDIAKDSNLTSESLKEILKKKNTVEKACNTDNIIEVLNTNQDNDRILLLSDVSSNSDSIEMDINNNGDLNNPQPNCIIDVESDDDNTRMLDHNIFKKLLAQSDRNKTLLNELCKAFIKIANDTAQEKTINSSQKNGEDLMKVDNLTVMKTDDETNKGTSNVKRSINPSNTNEEQPLPNAQCSLTNTQIVIVDPKTAVTAQKCNSSGRNENVSNISNALNIIKVSTEGSAATVSSKTKNTTVAANSKEIVAKPVGNNGSDICKDLSNIEKEHNDININTKSPEGKSDKERLIKLLVHILDHLSEDAANKKETSTVDRITQTNKEIVKTSTTGTTTGVPVTSITVQKITSQKAASQSKSPPTQSNFANSFKALPEVLPTVQPSRPTTGPSISQDASQRFDRRNYIPATNINSVRNPINSIGQSSECIPTTQPLAPVPMQAIPKPNPPVDPRYLQQSQQVQHIISHERHYGVQTVAQTVTNEMIAKDVRRAVQDPRLLKRTQHAQPMNCSGGTNPGHDVVPSNHYGAQLRLSYHDVRMRKPWQSLPNCFNPSWPYQSEQIRLPVPNAPIDYRNTPPPVNHHVERFQHLDQQQAAWTSQIGNYPNSNWSYTVKHNQQNI